MNHKQEFEQAIQSDFIELFSECKRQGAVRFAEFLQVWKQFGMVRIHNYYLPIPRVTKHDFLSSVCDIVLNYFISNANIPLLMIKVYSVFSLYVISCCASEKNSRFKIRVNYRNWQAFEKVRSFFDYVLNSENTEQIAQVSSSHLAILQCCANDFLKAYDYMCRAGNFLFSLSTFNSGILTDDLTRFNPTFPRDDFDSIIDIVLVRVGKKIIQSPLPKKRARLLEDDQNSPSESLEKGEDEESSENGDDDYDENYDEKKSFWQDGFNKDIIGDFAEPCMLNTSKINKFLESYCASKELFIEKYGADIGDTRMLNIVNKNYLNTLKDDINKFSSLRQEVASDIMEHGHVKSGIITSKIVESVDRFVPRDIPPSIIPVIVEVKNGTDERPKEKPKKDLPKKTVYTPINSKEKERWSIRSDAELNIGIGTEKENYVSAIVSSDGSFVQCIKDDINKTNTNKNTVGIPNNNNDKNDSIVNIDEVEEEREDEIEEGDDDDDDQSEGEQEKYDEKENGNDYNNVSYTNDYDNDDGPFHDYMDDFYYDYNDMDDG